MLIHNKQLNQYCLYFILFFSKKKVLKNGSSHGSGQVDLQKTWVESQVNPFLFQVKENRVRVGYFSGHKILTRFTMSTNNTLSHKIFLRKFCGCCITLIIALALQTFFLIKISRNNNKNIPNKNKTRPNNNK